MNNADYGLSLQKLICDRYDLQINDWAKAQFDANYNEEYEIELNTAVERIFQKVGAVPSRLLTYSQELTQNKQTTSPHNFILSNGKTLSIRTTKASDKVAPRTVGQAGYSVLNEYFSEIYGGKIESQADVRKLMYEHIHEVLPIFIEHLFQSDYTVLISRDNMESMQIIRSEEVADYSFSREEFSFTRGINDWTESTTLKYHGKSIAEIQTHKERTFKFRFQISNIPEWFRIIKENNETLGMSAEGAICDYFMLEKPESFANRTSTLIEEQLYPVIEDAFQYIPRPTKHTGSMAGNRGEQSKCSYDFELEKEETLSLKTNKGKMVCPPEVGQPSSKTCLLYFGDFFEDNLEEVDADSFKKMVMTHIEKIMPIYVEHLFEADWLLWIYKDKKEFKYIAISKNDIKQFEWEQEKFTFTKPTLEEWNESNTVKYDGLSIGEFQVHTNRKCYKFRFNMPNLLKLILKQK